MSCRGNELVDGDSDAIRSDASADSVSDCERHDRHAGQDKEKDRRGSRPGVSSQGQFLNLHLSQDGLLLRAEMGQNSYGLARFR